MSSSRLATASGCQAFPFQKVPFVLIPVEGVGLQPIRWVPGSLEVIVVRPDYRARLLHWREALINLPGHFHIQAQQAIRPCPPFGAALRSASCPGLSVWAVIPVEQGKTKPTKPWIIRVRRAQMLKQPFGAYVRFRLQILGY